MAEIAPAFGQTLEAAQGAAIRAEANREKASALVGAGAAVSDWLTADVYRWVTKPDFGAADPNFDAQANINQVPFVLQDKDREFLLESTNSESWQYNLKAIQDQRDRARAMGDAPITSFMVGMIDPVYLASDAASFGAARFVTAGRAARAAVGATTAGAASVVLSGIASEVRPVGTQEIILDALFNAGATGLAAGFAGKLSKVDNDFQGDMYQSTLQKPAPAGITGSLDNAVTVADNQARTLSEKFADGLAWNMHADLSKYDKGFADKLLSNARNATISAEDEIHGISKELNTAKYEYEDAFNKELNNRGAGTFSRAFKTDAPAIQSQLNKEVYLEMLRQESIVNRMERQGYDDAAIKAALEESSKNLSPTMKELTDKLNQVPFKSADTLRLSGVEGAENIRPKAGWLPRKFNPTGYHDMHDALVASGKSSRDADREIKRLIARSLRLVNSGMPEDVAKSVAASTVDRIKRKGAHEDPMFFMRKDSAEFNQVRDMFLEAGVPEDQVRKNLAYLTGEKAEKGKASFLKHRLDMDYRAGFTLNGKNYTVADLLDTDITTSLERYVDGVAGKSGMARVGWNSEATMQAARDEFMQKVRAVERNPNEISRIEKTVDNIFNHLQGKPSGEEMNKTLRLMSSVNRAVALGASGLWQTTEFAPMMAKYGMLKTMKTAMQELPALRSLFSEIGTDAAVSTRLQNILATGAHQDTRVRPIIQRYEDGFAIPVEDRVHMRMQQISQWIPYVNAMVYVQRYQARLAANLVVDRVVMAVNGNPKAIESLRMYGLTDDIMESLRSDIKQFGVDTAKWDYKTWEATRPIFGKMMDESVLKSKLGETPAFAAFDNVGKFVFSFRSFVLAAHNKILVGTAGREGFGPLALIMMYQFPLAMLATQANEVIKGREPLELDKLATKAVGQMGALGGLSEVAKVFTGESREWGAPGFIALDRSMSFLGTGAAAIKAEMSGKDGDWGRVAAGALSVTPIVAMAPLIGALQSHLKTKD